VNCRRKRYKKWQVQESGQKRVFNRDKRIDGPEGAGKRSTGSAFLTEMTSQNNYLEGRTKKLGTGSRTVNAKKVTSKEIVACQGFCIKYVKKIRKESGALNK